MKKETKEEEAQKKSKQASGQHTLCDIFCCNIAILSSRLKPSLHFLSTGWLSWFVLGLQAFHSQNARCLVPRIRGSTMQWTLLAIKYNEIRTYKGINTPPNHEMAPNRQYHASLTEIDFLKSQSKRCFICHIPNCT